MDQPQEKLYVVKIGGNVLDDEIGLNSFLSLFAAMEEKKILVHGGGNLATQLAEKLGIEQTLVDGRRITDAQTLEIVTMVYAGSINKSIVAKLIAKGCPAFGLCGADGSLIMAHKRIHQSIEYGFVGDVDSVNSRLIDTLLKSDQVLVIAPITSDGKGQLLNTNADTIAQEIAKAMSQIYAVELIYSFEKEGVLMDITDENSVLETLTPSLYAELKSTQKIFAGMIPKLDNAFSALDAGVKKVIIGKAGSIDLLIQGKKGTRIIQDGK